MEYTILGSLAHEFAHSLGLPDLYLDEDDDLYNPTGFWDLMGYTRNPPQSISAYMKYKYTEWLGTWGIDGIPSISPDVDSRYTIKPLMSDQIGGTVALKFKSPNMAPDEYIIIENRTSSSSTEVDANLPREGLLFYRVRVNEEGNNSASTGKDDTPLEVYLYRPGGKYDKNGNLLPSDFSEVIDATYPSNGKTMFADCIDPIAFLSDGRDSGITIVIIEDNGPGGSISFDYKVPVPELFYDLSTSYSLQQAIVLIEPGGRIVFVPDFY